jgi:DNA-binding transcriptional LysR family regulator
MAGVISGLGVGVVPSTVVSGRRWPGISLVPIVPSGLGPACVLLCSSRAPHLLLSTFARSIERAWADCRSDRSEASGRRQFG